MSSYRADQADLSFHGPGILEHLARSSTTGPAKARRQGECVREDFPDDPEMWVSHQPGRDLLG